MCPEGQTILETVAIVIHIVEKFTKIAKEDFTSLVKKYGLMCKNLVENQKQRIEYWEKKGNQIIK